MCGKCSVPAGDICRLSLCLGFRGCMWILAAASEWVYSKIFWERSVHTGPEFGMTPNKTSPGQINLEPNTAQTQTHRKNPTKKEALI